MSCYADQSCLAGALVLRAYRGRLLAPVTPSREPFARGCWIWVGGCCSAIAAALLYLSLGVERSLANQWWDGVLEASDAVLRWTCTPCRGTERLVVGGESWQGLRRTFPRVFGWFIISRVFLFFFCPRFCGNNFEPAGSFRG